MQKALTLKGEPAPKLPDIYPFDSLLIEQYGTFCSLLTDELFDRLRTRCKSESAPWINPEYYFGIYNLGLARLKHTTPEFVLEQCRAAKDQNDLMVAPSIARNLMIEYQNKLTGLRRIQGSKPNNPDLVDVGSSDLEVAESAMADFMGGGGIEEMLNITDVEKQRFFLQGFVALAREDVLPKLLKACQPVVEAGDHVLNMAFEMMGMERKVLELPTSRPALSEIETVE